MRQVVRRRQLRHHAERLQRQLARRRDDDCTRSLALLELQAGEQLHHRNHKRKGFARARPPITPLPQTYLAAPKTSFPLSSAGIAFAWIGVIVLNFIRSSTSCVFSILYPSPSRLPLRFSEENGTPEKNSALSSFDSSTQSTPKHTIYPSPPALWQQSPRPCGPPQSHRGQPQAPSTK